MFDCINWYIVLLIMSKIRYWHTGSQSSTSMGATYWQRIV